MSKIIGKDIHKKDILKYIKKNEIKILNLCYVGSDGRLKTLSFSTLDVHHLDSVLSNGERIDGSSVFPGVSTKSGDLFVVPRYSTAFSNPFSKMPTLNVLCSCFDKNGHPLLSAPQTVLRNAEQSFTDNTGFILQALGELEYYVIYKSELDVFAARSKHYHDSSPFTLWEDMRNKILHTIASLSIPVKYAHSEVGKIFLPDGYIAEQHEIEFLSTPASDTADNIAISKWVVRNVAFKYGVMATFSPVVEAGEVGSGMHFHLELLRNNKNWMSDKKDNLTKEALKMIGGILDFASSLSAFGNPTPVSYLRLATQRESPSSICWGEMNRNALIRIPLKMAGRQTIEFRAADGTAMVHLLLAGLILAVEYGLENEKSLTTAKRLHATAGEMATKRFDSLPSSCAEAARELEKKRTYYEKDKIFPPALIDAILKELNSRQEDDILKQDTNKIREIIKKYLNYG